MRKAFIVAIVGLMVLSVFVATSYADADPLGVSGTFPDRIFTVTRSPPGGPKSDTASASIPSAQSGTWSVRLDSITGAAVIVQVYRLDAGLWTLVSTSKLRAVGQTSTPADIFQGEMYEARFTPYGKAGPDVLSEHFVFNVAPIACFTFTPSAPVVGETVSFNASCSNDPDGSIAAYDWDFGDGNISIGVMTTHAYAVEGDKTVTLKVTDNLRSWNTTTETVKVTQPINRPPVAAFTWSPTTPKEMHVVTFDASASYDPDIGDMIASYNWDFGDTLCTPQPGCNIGTGKTPTHTYNTAGTYMVKLTVADTFGAQGFAFDNVTVVPNVLPVVDFFWTPAMPKEKQLVSFDASASYDPDGAIVEFHWVWGDGSSESTMASPFATHTYATAGDYLVTLHATDDDGAIGMMEKTITIAPLVPPVACFTYSPSTIYVGQPVSFNAGCSSDADGSIVSYAWDFGDGSSGTGVTPPGHPYASPGDKVVTLTVTDDDMLTDTFSATLTVLANNAPVAVISYPQPVQSLVPVSFDGTGSYDPDAGDSITAYLWSFADDGSTASTPTATHTFLKSGTWRVTLTVTDTFGAQGSAFVDVAVVNRPPVAVLSVDKLTRNTYESFAANGLGSSDPDGTIISYAIDWGDGTVTPESSGSHAYTKSGMYTIILTVTDNLGALASDSETVTVLNQPPQVVLDVTPLSALTFETFTADGTASSDIDGTIDLSGTFIDWGDTSPTTPGLFGTHQYTDGTRVYTITLTVKDNEGAISTKSQDVTVTNRAPVSSFTFTPASPSYNTAVSFDARASSDMDGTITDYHWVWGDGSSGSTGTNPLATHTYMAPNTYTVTLHVTDDDGVVGESTKTITVVNLAPNAVLSVDPLSALTFQTITANGAASTDPENDIASYQIDWGDGTITNAATGTHEYMDGTKDYVVTLTVTDRFGMTDTDSKTVSIANRPPTASLSVTPSSALTFETFTATGTASDMDGTVVSYVIDWGDGTAPTLAASGTHAYTKAGTYTITLTVTDNDGAPASDSRTVTALNREPTASFIFTPASPFVGDSVEFNAAGSSDMDGTIVSYEWTFGDGGVASGSLVTHAYTADGTYPVTLTVMDDNGATASTTQSVTVQPTGGPSVVWNYHDFFNVPYGEWWDMRTFYYGDYPIGANCFTADGITNQWCLPIDPTLPNTPSYPYTNWASLPTGDNAIFAPYRFDVTVTNSPVYTMDKPVILPTCPELNAALGGLYTYSCPSPLPTGGEVQIEESMQYVNTARSKALRDADGCPDFVLANDGLVMEDRMTLTMDAAAAARLFGVTTTTAWTPGVHTTALISTGCGGGDLLDPESGLLEKAMAAWFVSQGSGPYNVFNALGVRAQEAAVQASGFYDSVAGKHVLTITLIGWGHEALKARWFYWGATSYADGVSAGLAPKGWWGMEVPWFEDFLMSARIGGPSIGDGFNATISGVMQNHFRHSVDRGPDVIIGTADDEPKWVWAPALADRRPATPLEPVSELKAYLGLTYTHTTVGSIFFGIDFDYDYVPAVWALGSGDKQTFRFPTDTVVLYDPASPPVGPFTPPTLIPISTPIVFAYSVPATGVGTYDPATATLTVIGPSSPGTPPMSGTTPLESRPIYNLKP